MGVTSIWMNINNPCNEVIFVGIIPPLQEIAVYCSAWSKSRLYHMLLVLFTVLSVIGALFVLPIAAMVAFLLFKRNNVMYGNFSNGDFRAILNKMINDMYGGAYGASTARKTTGALSKYEALEVLGLGAGATPEQITSAYHRLMKFAHPDKGGLGIFCPKAQPSA
ncbi:hypothetical protein AM1145 [Anaplasma marginale str. St. Maries]|nr:hypothetical protein AM1145 [Anaplasma marginale str. St. Maries]